MPLLILLFFLVPLVEIYVLIEVGQVIGALPAIALCVLTALLGGALLRQQGLQTLKRGRMHLDRGSIPAMEMLEGLALAVGGALLMTPGFVTDAVGFACLIPYSRRLLVRAVLQRAQVTVMGSTGRRRPPPGGAHETIEGEYRRHNDG